MTEILVTGRIGSGKSEVCRYLASKGYPVYDSDSRTKALYDSVPGLKERIEEALGIPFGSLSVIFEDASRREALEALVYPLVLEDYRRFAQEACSEAVFFESAVAYGKPHFEGVFDRKVLVRAPYGLRLERNPLTAQREASQTEMPPEEADFIIENDSGLQELCDRVDQMLKTFRI